LELFFLLLQNGDTALHIAAAMGRRKLTRILLEAGCDKSLKNKVIMFNINQNASQLYIMLVSMF
jgi:ankyrin repeat protein